MAHMQPGAKSPVPKLGLNMIAGRYWNHLGISSNWGFPKIRDAFAQKGLYYIGVYIGVRLVWATTNSSQYDEGRYVRLRSILTVHLQVSHICLLVLSRESWNVLKRGCFHQEPVSLENSTF